MKEYLRGLTARAASVPAGGLATREYLQARILQSLQDGGAFLRWAFYGGTALRFLYGLPRFSEDLDFSILGSGTERGFESVFVRIERDFQREDYRVEIKTDFRKTVASVFVKFPGLPFELGLSARPNQVFSIKVEIDTRPPAGAGFETTIVRRHVTLNLCHHDKPSLLAGKLHAVLSRPWAKGRDLFDLVWYLADRDWPAPNLAFLNSALAQTGWTGLLLTSSNWKSIIRSRIAGIDWPMARADVQPFLERERDRDLISEDALARLLD